MTMNRVRHQKRKTAAVIIAALFSIPCVAHANDRVEFESAKSTTLNLIEALVDSGVISRQKADKLISDAEAKAKANFDELPGPEFKSRFAEAPKAAKPIVVAQNTPAPVPAQIAAPVVATIPQTNAPEVGADGKKIVRVAYIPEATKREMREQIKQEVIAQSKAESWGNPGALPDWLSRISVSGDFRARNEYTKLNESNTAPGSAFTDGVFTRAPDIVGSSLTGGKSSFNTQHDRDRTRIRARLDVNAKISDMVTTGVSLTTGNTTERTSTNQTLGQNFNKYSVVIDKAYITLNPTAWLSMSAGRIANPYFGTDLVWADDLNFEGVATTFKNDFGSGFKSFATIGWFPLREDSPGKSTSRALTGIQAGFDWAITPQTQFKLGTAVYNYHNLEGQSETNATHASATDYVTRYEYPEGFRQRGNTLFYVNSPDDPNINWGLASKFKELDLTMTLDLAQFDPFHVILTADYVKNMGFKADEIATRTGYTLQDSKDSGYLAKVQVGAPKVKARGDWNVALAYRSLGSDAVLDAFTNSDFGLGGTNNKGTMLTVNYGIDKNTWITGRWMSSDLISSGVPQRTGSTALTPTKLGVDMFQIELNARF